MRLGIFGGTFDPIHYGHLILAECCGEQAALDRVFFVPTAVAPHKSGQTHTAAEHRAAMIQAAIADHRAFVLSRYEIDRGGINYTAETLAHFQAEFPRAELFFLLGADMLHDLPNWRQPERICQMACPLVVGRPGVPLDLDCLASVTTPERMSQIRRMMVDMPPVGISATALRQKAAAGQSIRYQTPPAVVRYIEEHGLYR